MSPKNKYSKFFVPPDFLEMPSVAIEMSEKGVRYLSVKKTDKGLLPAKTGFIPVSKGVIRFGEVVKKNEIVKILDKIKKTTGTTFARVSLPEEKTYIFKVRIPKVEEKEIRQVLEFKIEENVPLSAAEAIFDYEIISHQKKSSHMDLIVSAVSSKTIDEISAVLADAGLQPVCFGLDSKNTARSVVKENNEQTLVVADIKDNQIVLSLVLDGLVWQTSTVNFGASTFTDALKKYYDISLEEAEKLKQDRLYTDSKESMEIFSYLINTVSAIKDEIFKFITYCNEREDVKDKVDKVILCGKDSAIVGMQKYLELNLNLDVDIANIWINNFSLADYVPTIGAVESLDYANVNGLNLYEL
ncbi:MAG: pilus assembly protein PilM [bacterium]